MDEDRRAIEGCGTAPTASSVANDRCAESDGGCRRMETSCGEVSRGPAPRTARGMVTYGMVTYDSISRTSARIGREQ
jgi:hypothetical protein